MKRYNSGYKLLGVGKNSFKDSAPDTKINKKEPSYTRRIPIGEDARTGQTVYMRLKDEDRIGIFDRCLHPETEVYTDKGSKPIEELFKQYAGDKVDEDEIGEWFEADLKVASKTDDGSIEWRSASRFYRQKCQNNLIELQTGSGEQIKVSKTHPLLTPDGWKKAENIEEDDYIAAPEQIPQKEHFQLEEKIAEMLAIQISEGSESEDRFSIHKKDKSELENWIKGYEQLGFSREYLNEKYREERDIYFVRIEQRKPIEKFKETLQDTFNYEWGNKAAKKKIPDTVKYAEKTTKKTFLKTYLDMDGSVHADQNMIEYSSASKGLLEDLKEMLLQFGISSSTCQKQVNEETYYRLTIGSEQAKKFSEEIGFREKSLEFHKETNSNTNGMPDASRIIDDLQDSPMPLGELSPYASDEKNPSKDKLRDLISQIENYIQIKEGEKELGNIKGVMVRTNTYEDFLNMDEEYLREKKSKVENIINHELIWRKVKCKREIKYNDYIYDLVVPSIHNYVASLLLSHNTGHGKTTLSKRLISGFYKGGSNILIATDPKSDYVDINKEGGASDSLIEEHKAGLFETEKKAEVPQSIPREMYIPRFLKEEVRNTKLPNDIDAFAFDIDELSESEFLTLMDTTSDTQQRAIKQAFRENDASIDNLHKLAPAHAPEEQSARALKDEVESVQNEKILSGKPKYNKNPLEPLKRDKAVSISFQGYDNFMRGSSRKKLELYVSILLRKLKQMITNGEISGQTLIYFEESDVFAGDDASISREDIIRMIDLGRAYSIPMIFAGQRPQQLDDDGNNILGQMNHFFIGKTVDEDGYKRCLKIAKLWEGYGESSREFQKVFRRMGKYQWMYVDVANSRYKVIDAFAPLCSHDDDATHSAGSRQTHL